MSPRTPPAPCERGSPSKRSPLLSRPHPAGEKPYKCPHCDYAGTQSASLKYHLERHHRGPRDAAGPPSTQPPSADARDELPSKAALFIRPDILRGAFKGLPGIDFRGGPASQQWTSGALSPGDHAGPAAGMPSEAPPDSLKGADLPPKSSHFSEMGRAYQGILGNGVNFQGSLQAFMESFVLGSLKKEKDVEDKAPPDPPSTKVHGADGAEGKASGKLAPRKAEKSQHEPLDLSVRPDAAPLTGAQVTLRDSIAWHGCLFCAFTTSSMELMALHLRANHLGRGAKRREGAPGREPAREASKLALLPAAQPSKEAALASATGPPDPAAEKAAQAQGREALGEPKGGPWPGHADPALCGFPAGFYRQFVGYPGTAGSGAPGPCPSKGPDAKAPSEDDGLTLLPDTTSKSPADDLSDIASSEDMDSTEGENHDDEEVEPEPDAPCPLPPALPEDGSGDAGAGLLPPGAPQPIAGLAPPPPQASEKPWHSLGLLPAPDPTAGPARPERAPPGPEKPLAVLSALRAYSSDGLAAFNGLASSAAGSGCIKRPDLCGKFRSPLPRGPFPRAFNSGAG